uniref:SMODS and SLOG-associating 2TM effector domain-containing protein n=2 Tax=Hemiselmis andersenii TaxID=464988 RepID=A0A7S0XXN4_HEMAN|mmetsp:Transcript_27800/g.64510  ORF Transcript_27800/g.64510 Transcript_27800/m.64510 type:complete len:653 (+) Transcript_27800:334-2292(+)
MLNTKVPVVFLDLRERKVCTATDRQSLIEAGMRAFQDSCDALHEAGRCENLDVCMIAYFYEIIYGDGNPNSTVSLEAGDGNPVPIHEAIKMHRQRMRVGAGGAGNKYRRMLHKLQPVTNEQIAELCAWMTRLVHTNFWRHNKDREQKEKEGKTYETHYSGEMQCFELCCRVLLSSESFYGAHIDDTKGLTHLLSTLVKLDRLPAENTLEALELLQQAWIEHDIAVHLAAGYKRMARLLYSLYLFIGLVIVTVTTVTGYLLQTPDNAEIAAHLQDAVFGLSLFSSFVLTIGAYFNPTKRGRQLRASASTLQSIIWRFRARVGEFLPPPNFPKQPDYNLCAAIASWRRELVAGTDLMSTALEKKYPPHIFTHLQHDGEIKELEDFRKEQMQAHELDVLNSRLLLLQKSQNLRRGSKKNGDSHGFFGRRVQVAPAEDDLEGGGKRGEGGAGEVESSFRRNSEMGPEEEQRNIVELEKKIAALSAVAGNFKPRYIDDFQSPVKPMQYVELRLLNHREFYQVRIPRCYMWMTFWQIVMAVLTVSGAVLAYIKSVSQFVAVSSAVAAAITSWGAYDDLGRRIERYTNAVRSINELVSWWKSLDDVDHASAENITRLIEMGENIINSERQSWLTATSSEDKKNAKEDDKQEEESWAKFA